MNLTDWLDFVRRLPVDTASFIARGRLPSHTRCSRRRRRLGLSAQGIEWLEDRALLATFVVDNIIDESDGNLATGDLSLREAIETANAQAGADTITFDPSVFVTGTVVHLTLGELAITDAVTITGPGQFVMKIDAGGDSRVFNIDDGDENNEADVELSGMMLTGGNATDGVGGGATPADRGGGISSRENLTVVNSTISGNMAQAAGGLVLYGPTNIVDSSIENNTAVYGAAGIGNVGVATITGSTISRNRTSERAGGISNIGTLTVNESTISDNRAGTGAGIANRGILHLANSTVSGNIGGSILGGGGGVWHGQYNTMNISNSTISGNVGGGVHIDGRGSSVTITTTTITNNAGGGVSAQSNIVSMTNSIIAGNIGSGGVPNEFEGTGVRGSYNLIGDPGTSGWFVHGSDNNVVGQDDGNGGRELLDITTVLAPLADNGGPTQTHALLSGSPAIDAGDPAFDPEAFTPALNTDQRGETFARVADGHGDGSAVVDIGAFEVPPPEQLVITESDDNTTVGEASNPDTITVALNRPPATAVVVALSVNDPAVVTTNPVQLTFTVANWDQPQTITVSGIADNLETGNINTSLVIAVNDELSDDDFDGLSETVSVMMLDAESVLPGNIDGDTDFDANDSFLIQLIQLAGTDAQIDQSKGSSTLSAEQIRTTITALLASAGDVDGDGDFDANDSFLIHLVQLSGTDLQIDQSKGSSSLSAVEIRANVKNLGGATTASVTAEPSAATPTFRVAQVARNLWVPQAQEAVAEPARADPLGVESLPPATNVDPDGDIFRKDFRHWIDAI
jgi:hypothetical protein